uniref:Uncharacterized protein n=1 Tax=Anopheles atroparvus TaxID=41427 RepID=A0AAG5DNC8_ANOAO
FIINFFFFWRRHFSRQDLNQIRIIANEKKRNSHARKKNILINSRKENVQETNGKNCFPEAGFFKNYEPVVRLTEWPNEE